MIAPSDVKDYSVFQVVKDRTDPLLSFDILQAKAEIFGIVGHKFNDPVTYPPDSVTLEPTLPAEVKLAFIKLTEYYSLINTDESRVKGIKSEKIGDYSYQASDSGQVQTVSLMSLLQGHIKTVGSAGSRFRMRVL